VTLAKTKGTKGTKKVREAPSCRIATLPPGLAAEAAAFARAVNPANDNRAAIQGVAAALQPPGRLAVLNSFYWGPRGVDLSVQFLDNPTPATRKLIVLHMNAWGDYANVKFRETGGAGDVRIARTPGGGYWSYLGTTIRQVPAGRPTMNLDSFTEATPESEYRRVVRHETGHTLGFPHEHLRKELVNLLDPAKTIAYGERAWGWNAATVRAQVLTPLEDYSITSPGLEPTPADATSIMCYQLPGECTRSGKPIPGGLDIDATDGAFAARIYPGAVHPPSGGFVPVSGPNEMVNVTLDTGSVVTPHVRAVESSLWQVGYRIAKRG
jgi:hypothetical protein